VVEVQTAMANRAAAIANDKRIAEAVSYAFEEYAQQKRIWRRSVFNHGKACGVIAPMALVKIET
jgi:hypothetical protein